MKGLLKHSWLYLICGFLTGFYSLFFRATVEVLCKYHLYWIESINTYGASFLSMLLTAAGGVASLIIVHRYSPVSSASGISMIILKTRGILNLSFKNVIPAKTVGGILSVTTGFFVGTEGPILQIAASLADKITRIVKIREHSTDYRELVTSSACAGLAAVFGAPLSSIALGCEEINPGWNIKKIFRLAICSFSAFLVTNRFYEHSYYNIGYSFKGSILDLNLILLTLTILSAFIMGWVYKISILKFARSQSQLSSLKSKLLTVLLVGSSVGFILTHLAIIDGHGHQLLVNTLKNHNMDLINLIAFSLISWILIMLCFCSGVVGGIFSPSLTLGVVFGYTSLKIMSQLFVIPYNHMTTYILIYALAFFVSFMKTPLTGVLIVLELFGVWYMWDVVIVTGALSYLLFKVFPSESFYHYLVDIRKKEFKQFEIKKVKA